MENRYEAKQKSLMTNQVTNRQNDAYLMCISRNDCYFLFLCVSNIDIDSYVDGNGVRACQMLAFNIKQHTVFVCMIFNSPVTRIHADQFRTND